MSYEKAAHLYDLFDRKDNIDFTFHYASRVGEVLDVGAGTGRIAIPLARRNLKVWCVEPSPAMRREFRKKLARFPELADKIQLVAGNAKAFNLDRLFPMAYLSGCFDHFRDEVERIASLENIRDHLVLRGLLLMDVHVGLMKDSPLSPAGGVRFDDKVIRRYVGSRVLPRERLLEVTIIYEVIMNGSMVERIEEQGMVGLVDRQEVLRAVRDAGFEIRKEWGGYDFRPYEEGDSLLVVEAVKKDGV